MVVVYKFITTGSGDGLELMVRLPHYVGDTTHPQNNTFLLLRRDTVEQEFQESLHGSFPEGGEEFCILVFVHNNSSDSMSQR